MSRQQEFAVSMLREPWLRCMPTRASSQPFRLSCSLARTSAGNPTYGLAYELDAIAATVIGGTSLSGGLGSIPFCVVGALIIGVLNNGMDPPWCKRLLAADCERFYHRYCRSHRCAQAERKQVITLDYIIY